MTLMIIGVIASMTIPALKKNTQNKETVAGVKKAYSTFSNAVAVAEAENGPVQFWGWGAQADGNSAVTGFNKIVTYLNIQKNCGTEKGCWADVQYEFFGQTGYNIDSSKDRAKARLADGSSLYLFVQGPNCNAVRGTSSQLQHVCADIDIDINGDKGPNRIGVDVFYFWITKEGVVPFGTPYDTTYPLSSCQTTGYACTAWILANENMNYLDAPVTWD